MTTLAKQSIGQGGLDPVFVAAAAGQKAKAGPTAFLAFRNTAGVARSVVINDPNTRGPVGAKAFDADVTVTLDPADPTGVNEVQTATVTADSGNFKLTFDGQQTAAIAAGATAAAVTAALVALSNVEAGDIVATGSDGGPYTLTFGSRYAESDVPLITGQDISLVGTLHGVAVVVAVAGVRPTSGETWVALGSRFADPSDGGLAAWTYDSIGGIVVGAFTL